MATFILTWNPKRYPRGKKDFVDLVRRAREEGYADTDWSCGNTKRIKPGDRVYLLRQGVEPRGIMASGEVLSHPFEGRHWDDKRRGQTALYVEVRFQALLDPETDGVLPISRLMEGRLSAIHWNTQISGISVPPELAGELERIWKDFLEERSAPFTFAEEVPEEYFEGAKRQIAVNVYERDRRAREACIRRHGTWCSVCGFDFSLAYGSLGEGYIHVHHIVPVSRIGKTYRLNPESDLRPVCPNCHAMLHHGRREPLPIAELRKIVSKQRCLRARSQPGH